jgi:hypothetical protein
MKRVYWTLRSNDSELQALMRRIVDISLCSAVIPTHHNARSRSGSNWQHLAVAVEDFLSSDGNLVRYMESTQRNHEKPTGVMELISKVRLELSNRKILGRAGGLCQEYPLDSGDKPTLILTRGVHLESRG